MTIWSAVKSSFGMYLSTSELLTWLINNGKLMLGSNLDPLWAPKSIDLDVERRLEVIFFISHILYLSYNNTYVGV